MNSANGSGRLAITGKDVLETVADAEASEGKVAVVILNWNQLGDTQECLRSLQKVQAPRFSVFLVDNGSVDGSPDDLAKLFPDIHVLRNKENLGYADGNNVGIRKALEEGADYVLLLNNDTVVHPEFLSELICVAERNLDAGILGAKVVYYDKPDTLWALGGDFQQPFGRIRMFGRDEPAYKLPMVSEEFDHVPGAVMFVRAQVFKEVGTLDSDFFLTWEDAEFCIRAQKHGWKILGVPGSVVLHKVSRATAGKLALYFGQRNRLLFTSRCLPRWQFTFVIVPFHFARLSAVVLREGLRGRFDLVKAATLGTLDFFRGRLGRGSISSVQRF